jgi:hypothetical protein
MASWATRRKSLYFVIFLLALGLFVGVPTFFTFYTPATCSDNKQNQNERGIDCGGPCAKLCTEDYAPLVYMWQRFVEVSPGLYNVLAYIENPNLSVVSGPTPYMFKLYDKDGILITERRGSASIPPGKKFAIFEPVLQTLQRKPYRATFEFTSAPLWRRVSSDLIIGISNVDVINDSNTGLPRVEATITSQSSDSFKNVEAVAIIYDKMGNVVNFSKTVIDNFPPSSSQNLFFTWPTVFSTTSSKVEILTRPI